MKRYSLLMLALMGTPALAAQPGVYGGAHLSAVNVDSGEGFKADFTTLGGQLGYLINDNFAVEGRLAFGVKDDTVNMYGYHVKVKLDNYVGIYAVPQVPLSDNISLYGLLGWNKVKVKASYMGSSDSGSDSSLAFGAGIKMPVADNANLYLEYAKLASDTKSLTFGVNFKF